MFLSNLFCQMKHKNHKNKSFDFLLELARVEPLLEHYHYFLKLPREIMRKHEVSTQYLKV
jgi:hypothetical protein